jgi:hypothetical protein
MVDLGSDEPNNHQDNEEKIAKHSYSRTCLRHSDSDV